MKQLAEQLKKIIAGDVFDDDATLAHYSTDYSLFAVKPRAVAYPKDREDIKQLVLFATKNKISLTARSAGTDMTGGPLNEGIILDMTKFLNKLLEIGSDFAVVEPGLYYRDFEKATLAKGLLFPPYPASKGLCAIGGIVANNSGGEKSLAYGKTAQWVSEVKMILRDGNEYAFHALTKPELNAKMSGTGVEAEIYCQTYKLIKDNYDAIMAAKPKVSKNSAGYALWDVYDRELQRFNLCNLIVGSQGTLGIITEATLKLIKPKAHSALLVIFINEFALLADVVPRILKHQPESFESYDDNTFKIALEFLPDLVKSMGASGVLSLGWRFLPEFWMAITGGTPKMVLIAEFTGDSEDEVHLKAHRAEAELIGLKLKTHVAKDDKEEEKYWTVRRESFKLLTDHSKGQRTEPFIDDIVVPPECLSEFLPKLHQILEPYHLTLTIAGHIGNGNFHIIPLGKVGDQNLRTTIPELEQKVFKLVVAYGGSITGEHNDGIVRTPYLELMYGAEICRLFAKVKNIFDPQNIFNPGKKASPSTERSSGSWVGDTVEYEIGHLNTQKL